MLKAKVIRKKPGAFKNHAEAVLKAVQREIALGGAAVRNTAVKSIQESPRGGESYVRYNPKRTGKASAAGEPPATDTGFLVSNISLEISPDRLSAEIISKAPYSAALEFGTSKMGARPFMQPALEENRHKIKAKVRASIKRAKGR
ncbi:MAG: HK97-gp10 family putative phage morphogenesis protein [Betaproteobacteria bacterium]